MNVLFFLLIASIFPGFLFEKSKPLVLIRDGDRYSFPTTYNDPKSPSLQHFCPEEKGLNEFLVLMKDKNSNCPRQVKPVLKKSEELTVGCGINGKSTYYDFVYRIRIEDDSTNGLQISSTEIKYQDLMVYRICYKYSTKETEFTYFPMTSPAILENIYLKNEMREIQGIDKDGYKLLENDFTQSLEKAYNKTFSIRKTLKPLMLVSPSDLAFFVWKTTAYNYLNVKPAFSNVIKMWNTINDFLRSMAVDVAQDIIKKKSLNRFYEGFNMIQISGAKDQLVLKNNQISLHLDNGKDIMVPKFHWKLVYIWKEKLIVAIILNNIPDASYFDESYKLCERDEKFETRIEILKEIDKHYDWEKFVQFCTHEVITDLYQLPGNLEYLLHNEYLLPLVMAYYDGKYHLPETYHGLKKLTDDPNQEQLLFCPIETRPNDESLHQGRCLVPNENNIPYCRKSVESFDVESKLTKINCNFSLRDMVYQICDRDKDNDENIRNKDSLLPTEPYNQVVYSFCLDSEKSRSIFTYHRIPALNLLDNENFKKERQTKYRSYDYSTEIKRSFFNDLNDPYATETNENGWRAMKWIPLVSPDDMVYPLLRKTTFHKYNMVQAWENVEILINIIHKRLRFQALLKNQELIQLNGVIYGFELDKSSRLYQRKENTIPKYLWTVAYNPEMTQSITVVIPNVPHEPYANNIERLCEENLCNVEEWDLDMVSKMSSAAYCCSSKVIIEEYGFPETSAVLEIEKLFWPLVLTYHQEKYQFPEAFNGLEIPLRNPDKKQTLFCPAETNNFINIDEHCLVPHKNIVPYCQKPMKYLWRRNEVSNIGCNAKDDVDFSVVYRLCIQHENDKNLTTFDQEVFRVCYNQQNKKTRYTYHQISSPALLRNKNLKNQQKIYYPMDTTNYQFEEEHFTNLKLAFDAKKSFKFKETDDEVHSLTEIMLTSPIHMAFASLIKPTYHIINTQPAWIDVDFTWDCVNEKLFYMANERDLKLIQINGSSNEILEMDGNKVYLDDDKQFGVANYLWKVVYNADMTESVAVIFHNLPRLYLKPLKMEMLCEPSSDLCDIQGLFNDVSRTLHFAYCCRSEVVTEKFNLTKTQNTLKIGEMKCKYQKPE